ncbi:MAG: hypothetical protein KGI54_06115 [Pseudomonadota bacterium]|nr:hypothetical protein [Pseudomonadota bacterium]
MTDNPIQDWEKRETIEELTDILHVAQEMGQRLSVESHGKAYDEVRRLAELLHQSRALAEKIRNHGLLRRM